MLRILVVDDLPDSTMSLQWLLQGWGHDARAAFDGDTALKMVESFLPDVVFLDLGMPKPNGYEVAKHLRQIDPLKPLIVAHSGYCMEADVRRAMEAGCNHHFAKPADLDQVKQLLEAYEQLLRRQSMN